MSARRLAELRCRIKTDPVYVEHSQDTSYLCIFRLSSIEPADYVRAIQEPHMLKVRILRWDRARKMNVVCPSFQEVWDNSLLFQELFLRARDPQEEKWRLQKRYGYKLATNFMPMYARELFGYFRAKCVLDPCAGWGDRLAGALSSECTESYVGFDPNVDLMAGYKRIVTEFSERDEKRFTVHPMRFERSAEVLSGYELFDFAFTGPPFFDYEHYGEYMPIYGNWIEEFYVPLFKITHDHLRAGSFFAVYLNDTSAGAIERFMLEEVPEFTTFAFRGKIGLIGGSSGTVRDVFVFQKESGRV